MIDIHSHILPGIDDGSDSVKTSLEMLRESRKNGVEAIVATPHCYAKTEADVDDFLIKRKKSYDRLMTGIEEYKEELPEIILGCEVNLARDISRFERMKELCIEGTDYILIEMPYTRWNSTLFDALYFLTLRKFRPIMAHIERFCDNNEFFDNLLDLDLIYQLNAESFLDRRMNAAIDFFFRNEMVQLIGSDMHNMDTRPTKILEAYRKIEKFYGRDCADYLAVNSHRILENKNIENFLFKKKNAFSRFMSKR